MRMVFKVTENGWFLYVTEVHHRSQVLCNYILHQTKKIDWNLYLLCLCSNIHRFDVTKKIAKGGKAGAKDPNKPKRPASAFFVFMEELCESYKKEHPKNESEVYPNDHGEDMDIDGNGNCGC